MVTTLIPGSRKMSLSIDDEGYRNYQVTHLVEVGADDGPANVRLTVGLPLPGSFWLFGDDSDDWVWCRSGMQIQPQLPMGGNRHYTVEQLFSNKPEKRCKDTPIEDPLLEPQKISGSFQKYQEEAAYDRFGAPVANSAHELFHGPKVEFDKNRLSITIQQNLLNHATPLVKSMMDTVNAYTLWGMPPRTVKLSGGGFERKFYGQCYLYYTRTLEFEVDGRTFDRDLLDEGTKVLNGHWDPVGRWRLDPIDGEDPDPNNPSHFIRFKDFNNENTRVVLDGRGKPADVGIGSASLGTNGGGPGNIHVEKYDESDFLLLGIPVTF